MDNIDINELKRLAKAATPGSCPAGLQPTSANMNFVAAANPAAILSILDRLKEAEAARDALMAASNDMVKSADNERRAAEEDANRLAREVSPPEAGDVVQLIADYYRVSEPAALRWLTGMFGINPRPLEG